MGFQPVAYLLLAPIDRITDHPFYCYVRLVDALHQMDGEFWFGAKGDGLRNTDFASAHRIIHPLVGQVQFPVDESMAKGGDVGKEDADLAVLDLACGATILLFDAYRALALFGKAGFVDSHNCLQGAKVFQGERTHLVAHAVLIPDGLGEQALHAIGGGFTGLFGQLPAIFARDATQKTLQKALHSLVGFWAGKVGSQTSMQLDQGLMPMDHVRQGR